MASKLLTRLLLRAKNNDDIILVTTQNDAQNADGAKLGLQILRKTMTLSVKYVVPSNLLFTTLSDEEQPGQRTDTVSIDNVLFCTGKDLNNFNEKTDFWAYHEQIVSDLNNAKSVDLDSNQMAEDLKYYLHQNLARRYLTVIATSVPSERLFSKAGRIMSESRNRIKGCRTSFYDLILFSGWLILAASAYRLQGTLHFKTDGSLKVDRREHPTGMRYASLQNRRKSGSQSLETPDRSEERLTYRSTGYRKPVTGNTQPK
nr:PREDICTED: uncharacterized protein LOC105678966 [Linepithema humile]